MLPFDRMSPRTKAGILVVLALLLFIPQGISTQHVPIVTGHSTFYNGSTYDQCLASVAGILRSRVLWFNDQVLVERYPGKGTYVFITEHGAKDPTGEPVLVSEGVKYVFTDPNGADWIVEEAYFATNAEAEADEKISAERQHVGVNFNRTYVWFVEIAASPILDQFPGERYPHSIYNFLVLVDTCKFHRNANTQAPMVHHSNATDLNDRNGHPNSELSHTHEGWSADIWIGKRPVVVPAADPGKANHYSSQWVSVNNPR